MLILNTSALQTRMNKKIENNKKQNKQMKTMNYQSPVVEIIEVEVEQGFTTSIDGGAFGDDGVVITPPVG